MRRTYEVKAYNSPRQFEKREWVGEVSGFTRKREVMKHAKLMNKHHPIVKVQSSDREFIEILGNTIPDSLNPNYMFQTIHGDLLSQIAKGEIDPVRLAKDELEARGHDIDNKWVGFNHSIK